ncbi:MAG: hypothetical protein IPH86_07310 [bacterium]|nr:hypothetical protein [bacterium]
MQEVRRGRDGGHRRGRPPPGCRGGIAAHPSPRPRRGVRLARPARRESVDSYVERLEHLEQIAESFDGVEKSYAIQAGREVRVLVNHTKVSDAEAALLAEEVSRRIEAELEYPGQIRIMVIRETRATAVAR